MSRSPRFMKDAVIGMAILVVILALWRLHSHPELFGAIGPWAETNIFGSSTLSLIPGPGRGGVGDHPLPPLMAGGVSSNRGGLPETNASSPPASQAPGLASRFVSNGPPGTNPVFTNFINTNGPVTVIAMTPPDSVETPPGVFSTTNVPGAAAMEQRLGQASAKGGDIQISLSWQNYNDLDLHCIDPAGQEIWFANRRSARTGGELDVDRNAQPPFTTAPVENIYWPVDGAPPGLYRVYVVFYAPHCQIDATPFLVRTVVQGRTNFFRSTIYFTGMRERKLICNMQYSPSNSDPAQRVRFLQ